MDELKQGRPTKYKPEFDALLIDHMASGLSYQSFAGECSVCIDTLYEWERANPSFSYAKKIGFEKNRTFWEKLGIQHIINKSDSSSESFGGGAGSSQSSSRSLNSTVYIFNMKNRFPKEWRDRVEVAGDKDAPLNITMNYERKKKPKGE